jgi:HEAT repeat protein
MRRKLMLFTLLLVVLLVAVWIVVPRESLPAFLRRAGSFGGKPTAYWVETLKTSADTEERRHAAYALAIISGDSGLDREAKEVVPVLVEGMKDQDEWVRQMSMNALGPMGRHAAPAIPALIAEAANRESKLRDVAILALGRIGPPAKEAVPVLLEVYREGGDKYRHEFAAQALKQIDPKAAAAANVP